VEEERKLFFMDISNMDERQKEYINLARDKVLAKKRMLANHLKGQNAMGGMNAPLAGYGGYEAWEHRRVSLEEAMEAWEHRRMSLEEAWEALEHRRVYLEERWKAWPTWEGWDWVALEEAMEGQVHRWVKLEAWGHRRVSMEPWEHHQGGFVASMVSPIPPSSNDANGEEAKSRDGNDNENVK
jgi:hypothetical protein